VVFIGGHLANTANKDLVYSKKPNHMGIYIGNVSNFKPNKGHIFFNLTDSICVGDTIGFENETTKYTVSELMIKGKNVTSANKKQLVEIGRMKGNIHIGDRIYKLASKELSANSKLSYSTENRKIFLSAFVKIRENEPIELTVSTISSDNDIFNNITVHQKSNIVAVKANSRPIDEERIKAKISKTNNTIFNFEHIEVDLGDNLFIPSISVLNELRRNCLEEILAISNSRIIRKGKNVKLGLTSNNKKIGTATVTVTGIGGYSGEETLEFKIIPKKVSIASVKSKAKKSLTVLWKKNPQATGYQVQWRKSSKFSSSLSKKVKGADATNTTIKKLSSKRKYYVRVRAYKVVNGKTYYGKWSTAKSVKVK